MLLPMNSRAKSFFSDIAYTACAAFQTPVAPMSEAGLAQREAARTGDAVAQSNKPCKGLKDQPESPQSASERAYEVAAAAGLIAETPPLRHTYSSSSDAEMASGTAGNPISPAGRPGSAAGHGPDSPEQDSPVTANRGGIASTSPRGRHATVCTAGCCMFVWQKTAASL